jgi:hypothetical protein
MTIEDRIRKAWSLESTKDWRPDNPAWGQCAVTALVVQDELGGTLLRGEVAGIGSHYWNRLPDGGELDLTREQFAPSVQITNPQERSREYVLSFPDTAKRYAVLRRRFEGQE